MKIKISWYDIVLAVALGVCLFFVKNTFFRFTLVVFLLFILIDVLTKPLYKDTKDTEETDENVVSDEEMEDVLLEDGEYSYDNYDEVCCPKCGEYLGKDVTICEGCGYGKEKVPTICPNCGKTVEDNIGFCTYCDYEFKQ